MLRLMLSLAGLLAYSQATPCNEAPLSVLATISPVGGWIPEIGDTLFNVDQALGIQDFHVIPSLNHDIIDQNNVMAGSTYCVPYISPASSAYWSTSGTLRWLHLVRSTNPAALTSVLKTSTCTLTSIVSLASTSASSTSTSTSTASTSTSTTSTSASSTSTSTSTASTSTSSTSTSASTASTSTSTASMSTSSTSTSTSSTSTSTSTASTSVSSTSTSTSTASTSTSSTSMSTSSASTSPTSSLLCGGNPAFSEIPTVYDGAHCDLGQCYANCLIDANCEAFGYCAAIGDCFLFESAIYNPVYDSGSGDTYYWNLDCFTKNVGYINPTRSA